MKRRGNQVWLGTSSLTHEIDCYKNPYSVRQFLNGKRTHAGKSSHRVRTIAY
jgi:hypothetical protein